MDCGNSEFKIQNAKEAGLHQAGLTPPSRFLFAFRILHVAFLLALLFPAATHAQVGEPIVEVVIQQEGQGVTDPLVLGLIETTVGEPLAMRDVRETIEHLTSLRRYDDIQPTAENVPGGVRITYVLFPSHPVDRVEFTGALGVSESDLRRLLTDRYGRAPGAARAAEAVEFLRRTYRSRGYPAAMVTTRVDETHNPDRATLIFQIEAGRRARIADVRFVQLDEDATTTITGIPAVRIGDPYDSETVDQSLREWENRLRERGYYEARASHAADIADDAYLRVTFRRGPRVEVAFAGDPLPASEQERLVPVRTEASADEDLLEDSALAIQRYLNERGYRDATARYTRAETPGELTITFTVTRGAHYTIDSVTVTGNSALPEAEVRDLLNLDTGDPFVDATLKSRAAELQNVYRARGHTRATVEPIQAALPPASPGAVDRRVEVRIQIVEGPRVVVRAVEFTGNGVITERELRALATPTPGAAYSLADVVTSRDRIELEYRNRGYETVNVAMMTTPVENDTQADIRYTIVEGPQSIIDHIIVVGNERTRTETITNELLFKEGEPVGYSALLNSRTRLFALGLFRRVDIQPLQHTGESLRDILIQVEEADRTTFGIGGGAEGVFRTRTGESGVAEERLEFAPRGFIEVGRRNLWGTNRSVNLFTRVSLRSTDVRVDENGLPLVGGEVVSNPGFNEFRVVGTFREPRAFRTGAEFIVTGIVEQAIRTTFNFSRRLVRAESGWRLGRGLSVTGRYSFERTKLFDEILTDQNPILIDRLFPQVRLSKFAGSFIRDTRDDLLDASSGNLFIVDGDVAARAIGSQVGFVQTYIQGFSYHRLPTARRMVVALGARVGAAHAFARPLPVTEEDVADLPASERFFAGGDTTVRGFSLDRLGSEDTISPSGFPLGGNAVIVLNSELRVSVTRNLQAVGFVDAGNVYRRARDLDFTDIRPAAGFGVRVQIPFAPIRFDWGFNLDRRELVPGTLERGNVFYISLGQAF
jgi:outer membrane protein insertion porin family